MVASVAFSIIIMVSVITMTVLYCDCTIVIEYYNRSFWKTKIEKEIM